MEDFILIKENLNLDALNVCISFPKYWLYVVESFSSDLNF